ncbi:hypothetical protein GQ42DRAFT_164918 [Ramicandelaber brevisporus]|nr:hypothetical protein GQ42DRAFT_164918 [Ramicandelaber brevisporus]
MPVRRQVPHRSFSTSSGGSSGSSGGSSFGSMQQQHRGSYSYSIPHGQPALMNVSPVMVPRRNTTGNVGGYSPASSPSTSSGHYYNPFATNGGYSERDSPPALSSSPSPLQQQQQQQQQHSTSFLRSSVASNVARVAMNGKPQSVDQSKTLVASLHNVMNGQLPLIPEQISMMQKHDQVAVIQVCLLPHMPRASAFKYESVSGSVAINVSSYGHNQRFSSQVQRKPSMDLIDLDPFEDDTVSSNGDSVGSVGKGQAGRRCEFLVDIEVRGQPSGPYDPAMFEGGDLDSPSASHPSLKQTKQQIKHIQKLKQQQLEQQQFEQQYKQQGYPMYNMGGGNVYKGSKASPGVISSAASTVVSPIKGLFGNVKSGMRKLLTTPSITTHVKNSIVITLPAQADIMYDGYDPIDLNLATMNICHGVLQVFVPLTRDGD